MPEHALASIDVTQGDRSMDVTWLEAGCCVVRHARLPNVEEVIAWVETHRPRVLGIDAPCKRNVKRTTRANVRQQHGFTRDRFLNCRVCEALLRQRNIQIYSTPQENPPGWIRAGWTIFDRLESELGYRIWDQPGPVRVSGPAPIAMEIYPHACFVVGLGARPANKQTIAGALERIAWLLHAAEEMQSPLEGDVWPSADLLTDLQARFARLQWSDIRTQGVNLPTLPSHDALDALAGLMVAIGCLKGTAWAVGDPEEGVIVLPSPPDRQYRPLESAARKSFT